MWIKKYLKKDYYKEQWKKISLGRIKSKLRKQYDFTEEQIKNVLEKQKHNPYDIKEQIKKVEEYCQDAWEYTELSQNISQILYDELIK